MKLSQYVRFIKVRDDYILFHSQIGNACRVDKKIYNILQNINNNQDELEIINEFMNKKFLVERDEDYLEKAREKQLSDLQEGNQVKTIQLVVSNCCNFKCKYCFENSIYCTDERMRDQHDFNNKMMKPIKAVEYVEKVIAYLKQSNERIQLHVQFFGGEPLTNKEAIKAVLDTFSDGEKYGVTLSYSIVTNGSLIDDDIARYFSKYKVAVIVSFDNPKQKDRDMKSGKDSVEETFRILDILRQYNVYTAFNSVLSSYTYTYFNTDIIDCALEHNVKEVGIVLDLDTQFYSKYPVEDIAKKIMQVVDYGSKVGILVSGYWMSTYLSILGQSEYKKGFKTCSGTGSQFSIEPNGNIYACKGTSGFFGNVNDIYALLSSENYKKYASRSIKNSDNCKTCEVEGFCAGFCLGPLEKDYDNINHIVESYCTLIKVLTNILLVREETLDYYEY